MSTKKKRPAFGSEPIQKIKLQGCKFDKTESTSNHFPWQVHRLSRKYQITLNHSELICSLEGFGRAA